MTRRDETAAKIAALNDAFRKGERPELGRIMLTSGARAAVAAWPLGEIALYEKVKSFAEFTEVYFIEADFAAKVAGEFNKMIEAVAAKAVVEES